MSTLRNIGPPSVLGASSAHASSSSHLPGVGAVSGATSRRSSPLCETRAGIQSQPHVGSTPNGDEWNAMSNAERWSISAPFSQLSQHRPAALCGNVPLDTGMVSVPSRDLRSLRLHLPFFWKRASHEWCELIHAVSSASTWTRGRRHVVRLDSCPDAICRRCSTDEIETNFHRTWSCPAKRSLDGIEKSQHLLAEASRHWESCPVFWLRGCLSRAWTQPPEMTELTLAEEHGPMAHNPSPLHALPSLWSGGLSQEANNQKIRAIADVVKGLSLLILWEA